MDRKIALLTAKRYAELVRNELSPESIMLFGSYANNKATDDSDIDIAVIYDEFDGEWLDTSARLWRLSYDIDVRIEPHLIDKSLDNTGFTSRILEAGVKI